MYMVWLYSFEVSTERRGEGENTCIILKMQLAV
jgi:hypothetical protein